MTSFVVRSAKRFHQVLAVDAIEVREVVVVPDTQLVRLHLLRRLVHGVGRLLQQFGRLVHLRRERPDDQVPVADAQVELDGGRELLALQFAEGVVEPARLELRGIEVFPPFGAGPAERVLQLDGVEARRGECGEGAGNVGGQLLPHAPELRPDRDALPGGAGQGRQRREDEGRDRCAAAELEDVASCRMRVHGVRPFDCAHRTPGTPGRASGRRSQPAVPRLTDRKHKYSILI